jgi:hypothetical protein
VTSGDSGVLGVDTNHSATTAQKINLFLILSITVTQRQHFIDFNDPGPGYKATCVCFLGPLSSMVAVLLWLASDPN